MKILQVISSFPPAYAYGGPTKVAYDISKELVKRGHEVTVYTTDACDGQSRLKYDENPMWMDGIEVHHFKNVSNKLASKNYSISPMMALALNKNIRDFDVVHLHEYRSFQAILVHHYAKRYNIPYILQAHGSVMPFFQKQGVKKIFDTLCGNRILKDVSKTIAVSEAEVGQYKKMEIHDNKIIIIPNMINADSFIHLPEKGTFRRQFGISEKNIILFLGRLHERKGIDFLIKSYADLKKEMWDVILVLAGPDEGYKNRAEMLINELNLMNNVKFTGYISEVEKLAAYVDADVLVYPSIFEIFGLVPFESIMCGTPVIVADDSGCGEIVRNANCGYLVKYGDINDLKYKMKRVIEHPKNGKEIVERGIKYIEENLAQDKVVNKVEGGYKDCL